MITAKPLIAGHITWDEPKGASSARGWLRVSHPQIGKNIPVGNYLDYGPNHYRSNECHRVETGVLCSNASPCRTCEPGNIHVVFHLTAGYARSFRYVETVQQAKDWLEYQLSHVIAEGK